MSGHRYHRVIRILPFKRQSGDGSDAQILRTRSQIIEEIALYVQAGRVLQRAEVQGRQKVIVRRQRLSSREVHAGRRHVHPCRAGAMRGNGSHAERRFGIRGRCRAGTGNRGQSQFHASQGQLEDVLRAIGPDVRTVGGVTLHIRITYMIT